jgi:hypothetical protein
VLPLNIAELQVAGFAHVTAIEPCPLITSGEGSVITGRFVTRQVDTIARVEILGANGSIEVLEGTTIHPRGTKTSPQVCLAFWNMEWCLAGSLIATFRRHLGRAEDIDRCPPAASESSAQAQPTLAQSSNDDLTQSGATQQSGTTLDGHLVLRRSLASVS